MIRVLVTEDFEAAQSALCQRLVELGVEAEGADNGKIALEKLSEAARENRPFDCVLIDLEMPVMDGWQLLSALDREYPYVARIIYTATYDDIVSMAKGLSCGAQYFVVADLMPFRDTLTLIRVAVAQKRLEKWKYDALASLDSNRICSGIVEILVESVDCTNVFVALCGAPKSDFVVESEATTSRGRRLFDRTDRINSLLGSPTMVVLGRDQTDRPLEEFGAVSSKSLQMWLSGIRTPGGELLGVVGVEHEHKGVVPAGYKPLIHDMCMIAGTAITAINYAQEKAEEQVDLLRTVNREFAHWVNSPLQVMSYVIDELTDDLKESQVSQNERLCEHMDSLRHVLSELKAIQSRIRQYEGRILVQLERMNLSVLVADCCREYRHRAKGENVALRVRAEKGVEILGDCEQLCYLMRCLLDNAFDAISSKEYSRQTETHGEIDIELTTDVEARRVRLRVADNGVGIQPSLMEQIFVPLFTTKEDLSNVHGIGLFSARHIALRHGAELVLESSTFGSGSVFALCVPLFEGDAELP